MATDPDELPRARLVREAREKLEDDIRSVMQLPKGRRFVWHIIDDLAGVQNGSFAPEPSVAAYAEGRRSVGRDLLQTVKRIAESGYVLMVREALDDGLALSRSLEAAQTDE